MTTLISRKFYEYLFPTFMMTVATSLAMVLNSVIVGNLLGANALAAVNLNNPVVNLISAAINIFVFGGNTVIAIAKGALKNDEANKSFSIVLTLGLLLTLLMMTFCLFNLQNIAGILCNWKSIELLTLTQGYLFPLVLSFPVLFLFLAVTAVMRVDGFPKFSAFVLIISNVINVVSSYCLIKYFNFGISGSSWGLFIGFFLGCIILSYYVFSNDRTLKLFKFDFNDIKNFLPKILMTGLPNGMTNIFMLLRIFILNIFILGIFNTVGIAVYALCVNVVYFAYIFVRGVSNTLLTIVGILFGEKDYSGIYQVIKTGFFVTIITSTVFIVIFSFFPDFISNLYGLKNPLERTLTQEALKSFAFCIPFFGFNYLFMCYFQCTKREKFSFIISALDNFVIVTSLVILFAKIKKDLLWWGFPLAEIVMFSLILLYSFYISKKENLTFPFLLPKTDLQTNVLNITLDNDISEAEKASKNVIKFCLENNLDEEMANKAGIIIEEVSINVLKISKYKKNVLDIKLTIVENTLNIRFRDNELKFDPIEYLKDKNNEVLYSGLELVRASVSDWNYVRNIGFNTLIIKI